MSEPLHELTLSEACRRLKSGALSSVALTEATFARIDALEPQLSAFARLLRERALARAQACDDAQRAGEALGALHGVPIAVKDLLYMAGYPTASGTLVMRDYDPGYTATVVERLEAAGAVIVGKTQLTEGAFGNHHPDIVPPKNPWNPAHWPGVSSSGSGVAVASGMAFGALGSDTGGSIRFPSASCGLVGIKPTYGRVSRHGAFALAESLDHIGPMTRCVEDAARMLAVIAGRDEADATTSDAAVPNYLADASASLAGLRIGVDWRYVSEGVDEDVVEAVRTSLATFEDLGATVVEVETPASYQVLADRWGLTTGKECAAAHAAFYPEHGELYGPSLSALIELGLTVSDDTYRALEDVRNRFRRELDVVLEQADLLIAPCMTSLPPTVEAMDHAAADEDERATFITFTAPFDYSGHPTLTLPAGLKDGLPTSFQLIGRHLEEGTLIRAGLAFETAAPFTHRPPL